MSHPTALQFFEGVMLLRCITVLCLARDKISSKHLVQKSGSLRALLKAHWPRNFWPLSSVLESMGIIQYLVSVRWSF